MLITERMLILIKRIKRDAKELRDLGIVIDDNYSAMVFVDKEIEPNENRSHIIDSVY